ncbi:hypothetical protein CTAYLR_000585 [Chrysophaeum taylorii]|uniref:Phosphodiesterase n=1 Tax=Chrysophaeum taylorii TaxID=2483200 RepID=A0AAD7XMC2_9STRA|nr:hypothetical protein CTAYLR_000585 [Chrysophaeum taylorii]
MRPLQKVASYVPSLIVRQCAEGVSVPATRELETVCVFCDVSGFTKLSEKMAQNGQGADGLRRHLNSYFSQMNKIVAGGGGDIFKFAGDAMIVLWPQDELEVVCQRAAQAAILIQRALHAAKLEEGVELSVKIGIGVGSVTILHIGGEAGRVEYVAVGEPLAQAFASEHRGRSGQVICSREAWVFAKRHFTGVEREDGFVLLDTEAPFDKVPATSIFKMLSFLDDVSTTASIRLEKTLESYVPADFESEMRRVSVLFVNLGLDLNEAARYQQAVERVHSVLRTAQKSVFKHGGDVNKFLMDDKGSTLIACFSQDDDEAPVRAVLCSLELCAQLPGIAIGLTSGDVFCGVAGSVNRRELTVLGDSVNLAARLMQRSDGIVCDASIKKECPDLEFTALGTIRVKGKSQPIEIYHPHGDQHRDYASCRQAQRAKRSALAALRAMEPAFPRFVCPIEEDDDDDGTSLLLLLQNSTITRLEKARLGLYRRKAALLRGEGSLTILEGESGSGKTDLLGWFVARVLPRTASIAYVAAQIGETLPREAVRDAKILLVDDGHHLDDFSSFSTKEGRMVVIAMRPRSATGLCCAPTTGVTNRRPCCGGGGASILKLEGIGFGRLDDCSLEEIQLLKTVAVLDRSVDRQALEDLCGGGDLPVPLDDLVDKGVLVEDEDVYALAPGLGPTLTTRLLADDRRLITERISRFQNRKEESVTQKFIQAANIFSEDTILKTGALHVQRHHHLIVQAEWKERYCVIRGGSHLEMFRHATDATPTQVVALKDSKVEVIDGCHFAVEAREYTKGSHRVKEPRRFLFGGNDIDSWVATIKLVIARSTPQRRSEDVGERPSASIADRSSSSLVVNNFGGGGGGGGCTVTVRVEGVRGLWNPFTEAEPQNAVVGLVVSGARVAQKQEVYEHEVTRDDAVWLEVREPQPFLTPDHLGDTRKFHITDLDSPMIWHDLGPPRGAWKQEKRQTAQIRASFTVKNLPPPPPPPQIANLASTKTLDLERQFELALSDPLVLKQFIGDPYEWDFDIWELDDRQLSTAARRLLVDRCHVLDRFAVPPLQLDNLLRLVRRLSREDNPYHNFRHAVDVALTAAWFGNNVVVVAKLSSLDVFALILSALCHDLDHPGRSNAFLVATSHHLAIRYNDFSVLEQHHAATLWLALSTPEFDVLQNLGAKHRRRFRELSVSAILATDVSSAKLLDPSENPVPALLRAADVSNVAKPWHVSKKWADRLQLEFRQQGDLERRLGIPISPQNDPSAHQHARLTLAFSDAKVRPIYNALKPLHPSIQICCDHLDKNRANWLDILGLSSY